LHYLTLKSESFLIY